MSQLPLTIHYVIPTSVIASVPPTSSVDETKRAIHTRAAETDFRIWHEVINASSIIVGREYTGAISNTGAVSTGIHALVPIVFGSVPWIPDAIYSSWQWTQRQRRERLYEETMKVLQSWESKREEVENLESVLQRGQELVEEMKRRNDKSLEAARQRLKEAKEYAYR